MLPDFTPKNWELYDQVKQFTPVNLYEHINGRAEFYIAYDVAGMTFANYMKDGLNGPFIDVFIYDMGSPTNAFGVFSAERSQEGTPVKLGREAYRQEANYYIWKGRYYITIIASETSEELRNIGREIAQKASHSLSDSGEQVWGLQVMPQKDRILGTIKYVKTDAMGLDFMKETYMARYRKFDTDIKHFLSQRESETTAEKTIQQYADFAKQYGKGTEAKVINGINLIVCDMEDYFDVVFQKSSLVAGVLSVKERGLAEKAAVEMFEQLP
jgi:REP element-mobilizing transposase RayT